MAQQLPPFDRGHVLVVGDVMLDRYWQGPAGRISPEAPVPVVKVEQTLDRPGGAGNVALNIAALGAPVSLCAVTGDDAEADTLESGLRGGQVQCRLQRVPDHRTTTKLRVISQRQQLLRLDFEQPAPPADAAALAASATAMLEGCGALVLSDYAKGTLAKPQVLISAARARGIPVLVDPKGTDFEAYRGATLLTPNQAELQAVLGVDDPEHLLEQAQVLLDQLQLQALLVTRGEQGMTLLRAGQPPLHLPARAREVFDVTGAGDTVVATLAAALAAGEALPRAVALANLAAGIVVGKAGTATVSAFELAAADSEGSEPGRGVLGLPELQQALAIARARGEKIVFTNGCFDLLHAGHVSYLQQARAQGDRLAVAVNSDASVARLKGEGRPLNPLGRRMSVLAGLAAVDWVVSFDTDTPEALLHSLQPDVLVKGGDYSRKEDVVGWQIVEGYGGRVAIMERIDDLSTTGLVARINAAED